MIKQSKRHIKTHSLIVLILAYSYIFSESEMSIIRIIWKLLSNEIDSIKIVAISDHKLAIKWSAYRLSCPQSHFDKTILKKIPPSVSPHSLQSIRTPFCLFFLKFCSFYWQTHITDLTANTPAASPASSYRCPSTLASRTKDHRSVAAPWTPEFGNKHQLRPLEIEDRSSSHPR